MSKFSHFCQVCHTTSDSSLLNGAQDQCLPLFECLRASMLLLCDAQQICAQKQLDHERSFLRVFKISRGHKASLRKLPSLAHALPMRDGSKPRHSISGPDMGVVRASFRNPRSVSAVLRDPALPRGMRKQTGPRLGSRVEINKMAGCEKEEFHAQRSIVLRIQVALGVCLNFPVHFVRDDVTSYILFSFRSLFPSTQSSLF